MTEVSTLPPSRRLRGCSTASTIAGMISRKNLDALTELGERRRTLRAELESVDRQIDEKLRKTYPEGWTWDELAKASALTLATLNSRLRKLGMVTDKSTRKRGSDVAQMRKAQARRARIEESGNAS